MSAGKDEWGPWIEWYGGAPCPVPDETLIEVDAGPCGIAFGYADKNHPAWWLRRGEMASVSPWVGTSWIERYRVRQPRGMKVLCEASETTPFDLTREREVEPA